MGGRWWKLPAIVRSSSSWQLGEAAMDGWIGAPAAPMALPGACFR